MLRNQITLSKCFFSTPQKIRKWVIAKRSYLRDNLYDHLWSKAFYEAITTWTSLSCFSLSVLSLRQWQDNGLCYYKLAVCSSRTVQRSSLHRAAVGAAAERKVWKQHLNFMICCKSKKSIQLSIASQCCNTTTIFPHNLALERTRASLY